MVARSWAAAVVVFLGDRKNTNHVTFLQLLLMPRYKKSRFLFFEIIDVLVMNFLTKKVLNLMFLPSGDTVI